jgi:hypothetical protein
MIRTCFLIFSILFVFDSFAQSTSSADNFSYEILKVTGDLNKDSLPDKVVVSQDTLDEKFPYRLQIFFVQPNGEFKLVVASTKLIEPQYPDGKSGMRSGNGFANVTISNGVVSVNNELLRGHYEHKFRFQNGNFELIGYSYVSSDGLGEMTSIDFNLSTGIRLEKTERYDTDKIISNTKKKILVKPLPKLQDVIPFENTLY